MDAIHAIGRVEFHFLFNSISTGQLIPLYPSRIMFVHLRVRTQKQYRRLPGRSYDDLSDN